VKEIHGFNATRGLKLIKLSAIGGGRPGGAEVTARGAPGKRKQRSADSVS
jgi:hypothetical protein